MPRTQKKIKRLPRKLQEQGDGFLHWGSQIKNAFGGGGSEVRSTRRPSCTPHEGSAVEAHHPSPPPLYFSDSPSKFFGVFSSSGESFPTSTSTLSSTTASSQTSTSTHMPRPISTAAERKCRRRRVTSKSLNASRNRHHHDSPQLPSTYYTAGYNATPNQPLPAVIPSEYQQRYDFPPPQSSYAILQSSGPPLAGHSSSILAPSQTGFESTFISSVPCSSDFSPLMTLHEGAALHVPSVRRLESPQMHVRHVEEARGSQFLPYSGFHTLPIPGPDVHFPEPLDSSRTFFNDTPASGFLGDGGLNGNLNFFGTDDQYNNTQDNMYNWSGLAQSVVPQAPHHHHLADWDTNYAHPLLPSNV